MSSEGPGDENSTHEPQEYTELSQRDIILMSMALFIPFCTIRGFGPFTTFMASQQPWNIHRAAHLNAGMSIGILLTPMLLPILLASESLFEGAIFMGAYAAVLLCLELLPRFPMFFHEILWFGRMESGWGAASLFLIILAVLNRHPLAESAQNLKPSILIDFFFASSSISLVINGFILETENYRIMFAIWAGLLLLPAIALVMSVPKTHYDPNFNEETASIKKDCGICCYGFRTIFSDWRTVLLNAVMCMNAFSMNVFLTVVGLYLRFTLNRTAKDVGVIMVSYFGGTMVGHVFNATCTRSSPEISSALGGCLMAFFFTVLAVFPLNKLSLVICACFFLGLAFQMIFYNGFVMSVNYGGSLNDIGVLACLLSYGIGAFIADYSCTVMWNSGGWDSVTLVLAVFSFVAVVSYILLLAVPKKDVEVENDAEVQPLIVQT